MSISGRKMVKIVAVGALLSMAAASWADEVPEPTQNPQAQVRLFRTKNIHTFLRLDTSAGKVSQVQWDPESKSRMIIPISSEDLANGTGTPGRFTLYPTENIFTFLLLNQVTGQVWQVQWGFDSGHRFVEPIDQVVVETQEKPAQ